MAARLEAHSLGNGLVGHVAVMLEIGQPFAYLADAILVEQRVEVLVHRLVDGLRDILLVRTNGMCQALDGEVLLADKADIVHLLIDFLQERSTLVVAEPGIGCRGSGAFGRLVAGLLGGLAVGKIGCLWIGCLVGRLYERRYLLFVCLDALAEAGAQLFLHVGLPDQLVVLAIEIFIALRELAVLSHSKDEQAGHGQQSDAAHDGYHAAGILLFVELDHLLLVFVHFMEELDVLDFPELIGGVDRVFQAHQLVLRLVFLLAVAHEAIALLLVLVYFEEQVGDFFSLCLLFGLFKKAERMVVHAHAHVRRSNV